MTESIKILLEQRHNVTIDPRSELMLNCTPDAHNDYGQIDWRQIPAAWLDGLRCMVQGCGNIVDEAGDMRCRDCAGL